MAAPGDDAVHADEPHDRVEQRGFEEPGGAVLRELHDLGDHEADEADELHQAEENGQPLRLGGRRHLGHGASVGGRRPEVVPVRLDPELREAVEARAEVEPRTTSEVIREALRRFLDVA